MDTITPVTFIWKLQSLGLLIQWIRTFNDAFDLLEEMGSVWNGQWRKCGSGGRMWKRLTERMNCPGMTGMASIACRILGKLMSMLSGRRAELILSDDFILSFLVITIGRFSYQSYKSLQSSSKKVF